MFGLTVEKVRIIPDFALTILVKTNHILIYMKGTQMKIYGFYG